ncbi:M20/M25/M40 family metallo-hydrolase [Anaerolentibacter hominis]|uniref:M20/M25/M40 family metallo-hydrolase n=1 Tax=Anaerolentibacter hominis TaxID=3079009 RepID=UPI0031B818C5
MEKGYILMKKTEIIAKLAQAQAQKLGEMNDRIFCFAEPGFKEVNSAGVLEDYLEEAGFEVKRGFAGLHTAFHARCELGEGISGQKLHIGLLCEYDALEDIGHGCAHQMQGPVIAGAAVILKEVLKEHPVVLSVIGTPAEEILSGGKTVMDEHGAFDDLDFSVMVHGGYHTQYDAPSLALRELDVEFHGISSHAGTAPEEGRNALEGILMMENGIAFLRGHVKSDVRMNTIIKNGGEVVNSVTAYAKAKVELRSKSVAYLDELYGRVLKIIEGAALATETEYKVTDIVRLPNTVVCESLAELMVENAEQFGCTNIKKEPMHPGSTDYGVVGAKIPCACLRLPVVPEDYPGHTKEWVEYGTSEIVHSSILYGAMAVAGTCYDIAADPAIFKKIRTDYQNMEKQ